MSNLKEPGVYRGEILSHHLGESASGLPYIEFQVRLQERKVVDCWEMVEPFVRPLIRFLSYAALPLTVADLARMGYRDPSMDRLDPDHPDSHSFQGQEVLLYCAHLYHGEKMRESWGLSKRH